MVKKILRTVLRGKGTYKFDMDKIFAEDIVKQMQKFAKHCKEKNVTVTFFPNGTWKTEK